MRLLLLLSFLILPILAFAQKPDVDGLWRGKITQNEGGFRSDYQFEIYLIQKGKKLTGRSYVYFEKAYAQMELVGRVVGKNDIVIQELKIVDFTELDGLEWCIKTFKLELIKTWSGYMQLEGDWAGATSFGPCIPGKVILKKVKPQA
ncbi:MAG: hypothetical protein MRY78_12325 [Saprospiraceae bacterium]|nr:hypothetical protein [Saprospiraceae bacterium]